MAPQLFQYHPRRSFAKKVSSPCLLGSKRARHGCSGVATTRDPASSSPTVTIKAKNGARGLRSLLLKRSVQGVWYPAGPDGMNQSTQRPFCGWIEYVSPGDTSSSV